MRNVLVLTPSYKGPSEEFRAMVRRLGGPAITWPGESDVTQGRMGAATLAFRFLSEDIRAEGVRFVLWLDDDMEAPAEVVARHAELLAHCAELYGIPALAGNYVQRKANHKLAAVADRFNPETKTIEWQGERYELPKVFAGLGALMMMREAFMEHCETAPWEEVEEDNQTPRKLVCCPRIDLLPNGRGRYYAEDFAYCDRVRGGVWLAPSSVRYGHEKATKTYVYPKG